LADPGPGQLPHLWVRDRAVDRLFTRAGGGGDPKIRKVEHRAHGRALRRELDAALAQHDSEPAQPTLTAELQSTGVILVLEGTDAAFPLKIDSLESFTRHRKTAKLAQWLLLSVTPPTEGTPEQAMVWVSDEYRARFLKLFEDYLSRTSEAGEPWNRELMANIARIRRAVLGDLWQSEGDPPITGSHWWELWLHRTPDGVDLLRRYAQSAGLRLATRTLMLGDRDIAWIKGSWTQLEALVFTAVPLAEIRRAEFAETTEELPRDEQDELAEELAERVTGANDSAPAVCHLDGGVMHTHRLLTASLHPDDTHSIAGLPTLGETNHGTLMAGLALYGPLEELLLNAEPVALTHCLESVNMLPDAPASNDPLAYGVVTAESVALPEATAAARRRVFCMPVTATPDSPGEPTLWSAAVDALAVGVDVASSDRGIEVLGTPSPEQARLFVISAGNVERLQQDYRAACDTAAVEDPAQAWNALTVGAHTELVSVPQDPTFDGWKALAADGDVSPFSRTSLLFGTNKWPIKPDICMEGGNALTDGVDGFDDFHPLLSLRSTDTRNDLALGSINATSAATAQAARLAALAIVRYPSYWPETIRGLLTHAAEWTPIMRSEVDAVRSRAGKLGMLRRYGWGVPTGENVLTSTLNAVTLITQDEFVPFDGPEHARRLLRLHQLPWPAETLQELGAANVTLRVTLSYFIEPNASRRGWRRRYAYASHGLRFALKAPLETVEQFVSRVNYEAQSEEDGQQRPSSRSDRWLMGADQQTLGSLHQDVWEGSAAELASSGVLAVHPVGGWWKNNTQRTDRIAMPVRYALIVSLKTAEQGVDLYTPIAVELQVPVETAIPIS
jgi:Subtilase family